MVQSRPAVQRELGVAAVCILFGLVKDLGTHCRGWQGEYPARSSTHKLGREAVQCAIFICAGLTRSKQNPMQW